MKGIYCTNQDQIPHTRVRSFTRKHIYDQMNGTSIPYQLNSTKGASWRNRDDANAPSKNFPHTPTSKNMIAPKNEINCDTYHHNGCDILPFVTLSLNWIVDPTPVLLVNLATREDPSPTSWLNLCCLYMQTPWIPPHPLHSSPSCKREAPSLPPPSSAQLHQHPQLIDQTPLSNRSSKGKQHLLVTEEGCSISRAELAARQSAWHFYSTTTLQQHLAL